MAINGFMQGFTSAVNPFSTVVTPPGDSAFSKTATQGKVDAIAKRTFPNDYDRGTIRPQPAPTFPDTPGFGGTAIGGFVNTFACNLGMSPFFDIHIPTYDLPPPPPVIPKELTEMA